MRELILVTAKDDEIDVELLRLDPEFMKNLLITAERVKRELNTKASSIVQIESCDVMIARSALMPKLRVFVDKIVDKVKEAMGRLTPRLTPSNGVVALVGGSSRITQIAERLKTAGLYVLEDDRSDPDTVVATGAGKVTATYHFGEEKIIRDNASSSIKLQVENGVLEVNYNEFIHTSSHTRHIIDKLQSRYHTHNRIVESSECYRPTLMLSIVMYLFARSLSILNPIDNRLLSSEIRSCHMRAQICTLQVWMRNRWSNFPSSKENVRPLWAIALCERFDVRLLATRSPEVKFRSPSNGNWTKAVSTDLRSYNDEDRHYILPNRMANVTS